MKRVCHCDYSRKQYNITTKSICIRCFLFANLLEDFNFVGQVTRYCGEDGVWNENVDNTNCVDDELVGILEKVLVYNV